MSRIEELLDQLTIEEMVALATGTGTWHGGFVERLDIPAMKVTDGPNGARGGSYSGSASAACFPAGVALGATWDVELVERVGHAIGEEVHSKGAHLLLAPTINLHRNPLGGRNFECYSEDPFLTGRLASSYVDGVQSTGAGATLKHFIANDSEFERHTIDCVIDERTLREVYLRPFEMAIERSNPVSVMSSYNKVNGVSSSDNHELLTTILKDEWGYEGFVISDWFGTRSTAGAANAGLDLEMPGPPRIFGDALVEAVKSGEVGEEVVRDKARRVLVAMERMDAFERRDHSEQSLDKAEHRTVARKAATDAMVLLTNDGVMPVDPTSVKRVAVIGPNADQARIQGGGSAGVNPHYAVTPFEGICAAVGDDVEVVAALGCGIDARTPHLDTRLVRPAGNDELRGCWTARYFAIGAHDPAVVRETRRSHFVWMNDITEGVRATAMRVELSGEIIPSETSTWTFSLISAGRSRLFVDDELIVDAWTDWAPGPEFFGNGCAEVAGEIDLVVGEPRQIRVEFENDSETNHLSGLTVGARAAVRHDLIDRAVDLAASVDLAVLVVGQNADWETEGRDRDMFELPGDQGELVRRVAAVNERTIVFVNAGSPVDLDWSDAPNALLYMWYPGQEDGNAVADVLFGSSPPGGRLPTTFPKQMSDTPSFGNYPGEFGKVHYGEGQLIGHRWYDTRQIEPAFCFGHGLTTTDMHWGEVTSSAGDSSTRILVDITNSGQRAGVEVVQVYAHRPTSAVMRPEQILVGFAKVRLGPGESAAAEVVVEHADLRHWDPDQHGWILEPGEIELRVGRSSREFVETITIDV
ncbi:MAG: glycoside hydrolase family 3 protein [Actinomycetia bacterium]|nr:glycoside hydrolase family 3 protein [Actinomycetes bacterium]